MQITRPLTALIFLAALSSCDDAPPTVTSSRTEPIACEDLAQADYGTLGEDAPNITKASSVEAASGLPAYCDITGTIKTAVNFGVRLPTENWNGRFLMQGCSGLCGTVEMNRTDDALIRGYAVAHTDMGHQGPQVGGATWAYNNRETEIDYAYRATHVTTLAAKALIDVFYSDQLKTSYIRGCSTGGRQAMVAAQMYPEDFDGVIAGAPVNSDTSILNIYWAAEVTTGDDGKPLFDANTLNLLTQGALAACDKNDGLEDGIITVPLACDFDPASLQCTDNEVNACLSSEQVSAAHKLYDGPQTSKGEKLASAGFMRGAESGMVFSLVGMGEFGPMFPGVMQSNQQYLAYEQDPPLTEEKIPFDFDTDPARMTFMNEIMGGTDPDLRAFEKKGGKLLLYHGWNDESLHPTASVDYWKAVQREMGHETDIDAFFRLFMIPGMMHCGAGPGTDTVDYLSVMEKWVEEGEAPDGLLSHKTDGKRTFEKQPQFPLEETEIKFSRPLYPYPITTKYKGAGDPKEAGSFAPERAN